MQIQTIDARATGADGGKAGCILLVLRWSVAVQLDLRARPKVHIRVQPCLARSHPQGLPPPPVRLQAARAHAKPLRGVGVDEAVCHDAVRAGIQPRRLKTENR